ncbi:excalibur calcium-binding domain-containing protein [Micromonospora radicis]|uniref:Calcium-binding protein n=1 Tax=Micromonospora radicis TaxID=1894971 RepID=A0A418N0C6_9ACTN|nr:excalibur calcium-binding domain-containing protein [Micromonospora radicis]RIV41282.1 calcium-binding protein [Micromonospora radicis]
MVSRLVRAALVVALVLGGGSLAVVSPAQAAAPKFKNCAAMHKKYKHGVGKKGARDKVRGKTKPVTNFKVSTAIYNANTKLDRDKDGVACEKR